MIEATLDNCTTVNLVNETPIDSKQCYAVVVLVRKDGQELEALSKRPYAEAEAFFSDILTGSDLRGSR